MSERRVGTVVAAAEDGGVWIDIAPLPDMTGYTTMIREAQAALWRTALTWVEMPAAERFGTTATEDSMASEAKDWRDAYPKGTRFEAFIGRDWTVCVSRGAGPGLALYCETADTHETLYRTEDSCRPLPAPAAAKGEKREPRVGDVWRGGKSSWTVTVTAPCETTASGRWIVGRASDNPGHVGRWWFDPSWTLLPPGPEPAEEFSDEERRAVAEQRGQPWSQPEWRAYTAACEVGTEALGHAMCGYWSAGLDAVLRLRRDKAAAKGEAPRDGWLRDGMRIKSCGTGEEYTAQAVAGGWVVMGRNGSANSAVISASTLQACYEPVAPAPPQSASTTTAKVSVDPSASQPTRKWTGEKTTTAKPAAPHGPLCPCCKDTHLRRVGETGDMLRCGHCQWTGSFARLREAHRPGPSVAVVGIACPACGGTARIGHNGIYACESCAWSGGEQLAKQRRAGKERRYKVGDRVSFGGTQGQVMAVVEGGYVVAAREHHGWHVVTGPDGKPRSVEDWREVRHNVNEADVAPWPAVAP